MSKLLLVMIWEKLGEAGRISGKSLRILENLGGGRGFAKRPYKVIDYLGNQLWQSLRSLPKYRDTKVNFRAFGIASIDSVFLNAVEEL